ncbi:MAG TPA: hypothetical protein VF169_23975 [Albitalea sp.]|uniref:hypothetical protein n=1 Tax=Piscinibacter sp. TaxID=1903157 RepID=UPI002ED45633
MGTAPRLPDDDAPLDAKTLDRFLSSMGTGMVLVGGQALAFWMDRYGIDPEGATISNDGDALGNVGKARDIARSLKAALVVPDRRALTSLIAQIRVPVGDGKARNIDVLHSVYTVGGPRKSATFTRRVVQRSVEAQWRDGKAIRVMHPLDVLESRVHNAAGLLREKGSHVLTQAVWAIEVARTAILKVARASDPGEERIGQMIQEVFRLADSQAGRRVLRDHGIEVLDAIDVDGLARAAPSVREQLLRVEVSWNRRHTVR